MFGNENYANVRLDIHIPAQVMQQQVMHHMREISEHVKTGMEKAIGNMNVAMVETAQEVAEQIIKNKLRLATQRAFEDVFSNRNLDLSEKLNEVIDEAVRQSMKNFPFEKLKEVLASERIRMIDEVMEDDSQSRKDY